MVELYAVANIEFWFKSFGFCDWPVLSEERASTWYGYGFHLFFLRNSFHQWSAVWKSLSQSLITTHHDEDLPPGFPPVDAEITVSFSALHCQRLCPAFPSPNKISFVKKDVECTRLVEWIELFKMLFRYRKIMLLYTAASSASHEWKRIRGIYGRHGTTETRNSFKQKVRRGITSNWSWDAE